MNKNKFNTVIIVKRGKSHLEMDFKEEIIEKLFPQGFVEHYGFRVRTVRDSLDYIHTYTKENLDMIGTGNCSCIYCGSYFSGFEVSRIFMESSGKYTALCPRCEIDAVVPCIIPQEVLEMLKDRWFS